MIDAFLESFPLFWEGYLTGWAAAVMLALLGVFLVAWDQVFLGAVLGQAAMCGVALGGVAFGSLHGAHWVGAIVLSVATVLLVLAWGRGRPNPVLGALFATFGAGTVLAATGDPHGMEETRQILMSSLITPRPTDAVLVGSACVVLAPLAWILRRRLFFAILDRDAAAVQGLRPGFSLLLLGIAAAVAVGAALHATGLVFTFGCLVLPALIARRGCPSARSSLIAAPLLALFATTAAYVLALAWDMPPGPLAIALLAAGYAAVTLVARR